MPSFGTPGTPGTVSYFRLLSSHLCLGLRTFMAIPLISISPHLSGPYGAAALIRRTFVRGVSLGSIIGDAGGRSKEETVVSSSLSPQCSLRQKALFAWFASPAFARARFRGSEALSRLSSFFVPLLVGILFSCANSGSTGMQVLETQTVGSHTEPQSHEGGELFRERSSLWSLCLCVR